MNEERNKAVVLEAFDGYAPCNGSNCSDNVYTHMTQWLQAVQ